MARECARAMMATVTEWAAADAVCLQQAMRMTNEAFAVRIGIATRTVAKWRANPGMRLSLDVQQALDTLMRQADSETVERFRAVRLGRRDEDAEASERAKWAQALRRRPQLHGVISWLQSQDPDGAGRDVFDRVAHTALEHSRGGGHAGAGANGIDRQAVADVLVAHYADELSAEFGLVALCVGERTLQTSLVAEPVWLTVRDDLRGGCERHTFDDPGVAAGSRLQVEVIAAAVARLGTILAERVRFTDAPLYRLLDVWHDGVGLRMSFGLTSFGRYAVTADLLEAETLAAVATRARRLVLREALLPTIAAVRDLGRRDCVGGPLGLVAFARPARRGRSSDYLLLVQERGERVLNAEGRLSVIPKCFHQPMVEVREDVHVGLSLVRELEEELFGRDELETEVVARLADPMHESRLSAPMRWLLDRPQAWSAEQTGFGFNLVSGNFEVPALVAVHDEEFWERFGGAVQANWEAQRLIRISSLDEAGLERLLASAAWSDEGLVAFGLGLERLAAVGSDRVAAPDVRAKVEG